MQKPIDFTLDDIVTAAQDAGCSDAFVNSLQFTLPQEGIYFENVPGDAGAIPVAVWIRLTTTFT